MITQTQMTKISKLQEKAVQLIEPKSEIQTIYLKHGILPIEKLVKLENYKVWYKYYHNLIPKKLKEIMTVDSNRKSIAKTHRYNTRQRKELNLPKADGLYKKTFFVKGLLDYSKLANAAKTSPSLGQFIGKCKRNIVILNNYIASCTISCVYIVGEILLCYHKRYMNIKHTVHIK